MKLSKLYTNQPKLFTPISFYDGFNVILGEVKTTLDKDTHNLGKSLLVSIIDFCFLRKKESFPLIHVTQLQDFVFYLEIKITENKFVTVARSISNPTKVCFKYHYKADQDFRGLLENEWDKYNLAFAAAKNLLDGLLNLQFLGDNSYRRFISYLLRNQTDFNDPFRLSSKNRGKDIDWKPNLARLLGFNEQLLISLYEKKEQLKKLKEKQKEIEKEAEALSNVKTLSDVEGEINVIKSRIENIETQLEVLNFGEQEKQTIAELVDLLNDRIATLNDELFYAENSEKRITKSLEEDNIIFNPDEAAHLFKEAGVIFEGQIKKEFSDLIQFHRSISEERKFYLQNELTKVKELIKNTSLELDELNKQRASKLEFLQGNDIFEKYKLLSKDLVDLKARQLHLEQTRELIYKKEKVKDQIAEFNLEVEGIERAIREDVKHNIQPETTFGQIRHYFSQIIQQTLKKDAYLTVNVNNEGNLNFEYKFSGTEEHQGHTYKKLLCIAFDMALARVYIEKGYSLFLFHDGIFESLDNRVKERLLNVVREYSSYGLQQIITLIDSEIPFGAKEFISNNEVALVLHDRDDSGRLFKIPAW